MHLKPFTRNNALIACSINQSRTSTIHCLWHDIGSMSRCRNDTRLFHALLVDIAYSINQPLDIMMKHTNAAKKLQRLFHLAVVALLVGLVAPVQAQDKAAVEAYNAGVAAYKAKDFAGALTNFSKAASLGNTAGDTKTARSAAKNGSKAAYKVGTSQIKKDQFSEALASFSKGIELDSEFYANYVGRAMALKKSGSVADAMKAYLDAADASSKAGKLDKRKDMYEQAEGFSAKAIAQKDYDKALEYGQMHLDLRESAEVHFHMAYAYSETGNSAKALEHADKGIELSKGSRAAKAKLYIIKAESHENLQQFEQALAAYKQANVGEYAARAKYKIETLGGGSN